MPHVRALSLALSFGLLAGAVAHADVTIAALPATPADATAMGIFTFDKSDQIVAFEEKPNAERLGQMVEDVRRGPPTPMVVMEGAPLLPWLVEHHLADPAVAVWLVPTPEFQRARLLEGWGDAVRRARSRSEH